MLDFFSIPRWISSKPSRDDLDDENSNLPWPVTQPRGSPSIRSWKNSSQLSISPPIPRSTATSLTGFDNPYLTAAGSAPENTQELWQFRQPNSSLTRLGATIGSTSPVSSNGARSGASGNSKAQLQPHVQPHPTHEDSANTASFNDGPPAVIRIETTASPHTDVHAHTIRRTVSSPPMSPHHTSPSSSISSSEITPTALVNNGQGGRWGLRLHTEQAFFGSTQSLPTPGPGHLRSLGMHLPGDDETMDDVVLGTNTDVYGYSYAYPLAKQLSPIAEQDYFSPDSLKRTKSLPASSSGTASRTGSDKNLRISASAASASPGGSQTSELTRPSPSYPSPFITRQLNRTASQTSSRTHVSAASSVPRLSAKSADAPIIPPLDLRPPFPGPHPSPPASASGSVPPLRPRRSFVHSMPMITGSAEGDDLGDGDEYAGTTESLHADSFVTATSDDYIGRPRRANSARDIDIVDKESLVLGWDHRNVEAASVRSAGSRMPSASESFITRRWDRDVALGTGVRTFRAKRQWITVTPAFWAFWLGFICPFLWLIGGWHFTNFGEQPPRLTFWEFYFNAGYWKEMCCGKRNKKREMGHLRREGKKVQPPPLPRWVTEKQASDDGRARLNDPKRSLKGISFGYPFIPRQVPVGRDQTLLRRAFTRMVEILDKPNRIFDQLYGVKLHEVRGRPESGRRMFDPWIQRCRYALCYAMVLIAIGLCVASTYLIVYNTRQLR